MELERRGFGGVNHTWSNVESSKMLGKAMAEDRYDSVLAFYLARYAGLRIHECFRTDTAMAEQVLRENAVTIKGGKARTIPINGKIAVAMSSHSPRPEAVSARWDAHRPGHQPPVILHHAASGRCTRCEF